MADLYNTDIPSFRNYIRMSFLNAQGEAGTKALQEKDQLKGAPKCGPQDCHHPEIPGETYTSLHFQFRSWKATSPSLLSLSPIISWESTREPLTCPTTPEGWKELETELRQKWIVPHVIGALDRNHVANRKPPKSVSSTITTRVLLYSPVGPVVDDEYRFRWVDIGTEGSCSDSQPKEKIENCSIGFPEASPVESDGPCLPYFILADGAFALKTWLMKPYSTIANYRISRGRRVVENAKHSLFQI